MYDPTIGQWMRQDPLFPDSGVNPYEYCGDNPANEVDPTGLAALPSSARGTWVEGTPGNGVFEYSDIPQNRTDGLVGKRVRFQNGSIAVGGLPAELYYGGSAEAASVQIETVKGTAADFTAARDAMRRKLGNPTWEPPAGYTWNHAGDCNSKTLELVETAKHSKIHHQGSAAQPRANARNVKANVSFTPKVVAALTIYLTLREAAQAAGVVQPDFQEVGKIDYYFVASDGSIFVVKEYHGLASLFASDYREYIAGPRKGQTENLTSEQVESYRKQGEAVWGKYIPGGLFTEPKFIPGTQRSSIPLYEDGAVVGWIDENGTHFYPTPFY